ncbi:MAG: two-component regulator propeller domain-containing protein, partial [Bacteroidota bacterium]
LQVGVSQSNYLAHIDHYGVKDGLSHREVFTIHQDQNGFIWVGTRYGLNRFDGKTFKSWTVEKQGLTSNTIHHIREDAGGWLWIITAEYWYSGIKVTHLSFVNIQSGEVQSLEERFGDSSPFDLSKANYIYADGSGGMVLGSAVGEHFHFHPKKGFRRIALPFDFLPIDQYGKPGQPGIWGLKLAVDSLGINQLVQLDSHNFEILQQYDLSKAIDYVQLFFTAQDQYWLANTLDGEHPELYKCHQQRAHLVEDFTRLNDRINPQASLSDWSKRLYYQPRHNLFWFKATPHFYVFHPEEGMIFDFQDNHQDLIDADIQNVVFDRRGVAWLGTVNGLYKVNLKPNPFKNILSEAYANYTVKQAYSCRGIWADEREILVNTYKGRMRWDKTNKQAEKLAYSLMMDTPTLSNSWMHTPFSVIKGRDSSTLWFGEVELVKRNRITGEEEVFFWEQSEDQIWSIYEDAQNQIWLGTEKKGIAYLDQTSKQLKVAEGFPADLQQSFVYAFVESEEEWIWVATNTGLYRWSIEQETVQRFCTDAPLEQRLPSNQIHHVHEDRTGVLWLATGGSGLLRLQLDEDRKKINDLKQFTIAHDLPNNILYAVYEDGFGKLWISSDYGIIRFDKETQVVKTYLIEDGIAHPEFNRIAHFQDKAGTIYFGGLNGVTRFHPSNFSDQNLFETEPSLCITDFQQFDGKSETLINKTAEIKQSKSIQLAPNDRFFRLQFALLDYQNTELHRYAWKIEGLD